MKFNEFRHHHSMIPFDQLSESEKCKDRAALGHIPHFMALDGLEVFKTETSRREGRNPEKEKENT